MRLAHYVYAPPLSLWRSLAGAQLNVALIVQLKHQQKVNNNNNNVDKKEFAYCGRNM